MDRVADVLESFIQSNGMTSHRIAARPCCAPTWLSSLLVMFGCSQVWLPTSMPASTIRLAASGLAATLFPIRKNVAFASFWLRICSSRSVYGLGPSSNVNATHLTFEQSTSSALASFTWPVRPPMTSTAAAATTLITVHQYGQVRLRERRAARKGTRAAYRAALAAALRRSGERAGADLLQHLGDQRRNRRPLAAHERDVGEQRAAFPRLDRRRDAIVASDTKVVPLGDVVGEHHPRPGAQSGQHGEQNIALQRLRLVDDHERVMQGTAADVCQREHLGHPPRHYSAGHPGGGPPPQ